MHRQLSIVLTVLLLGGSALAAEITFQVSEVDVGQDVDIGGALQIVGDEWLPFGIDMLAGVGEVWVYGPPNFDPFPPGTDNNGAFFIGPDPFEIVFDVPVSGLEVDWWNNGLVDFTLQAFDVNDNPLEVMPHTGAEGFGTDIFAGSVKRLEMVGGSGSVCLANLRFDIGLPMSSAWSLALFFVLLSAAIVGALAWRRRGMSAEV